MKIVYFDQRSSKS